MLNQTFTMRKLRVTMLTLMLLAFSAGSYASVCAPKTEKAQPIQNELVKPMAIENCVMTLAIGTMYCVDHAYPAEDSKTNKDGLCVPIKLGKVSTVKLTNYKFLGTQRWFS